MKITTSNESDDAREALQILDRSISETRRAVRSEGGNYFLIWGSVYFLVPLIILTGSSMAAWVANGLVVAGVLATLVASHRSSFRSDLDSRLWAFWGILFGYAVVWLIILGGTGFPKLQLVVDGRQTWGFGVSVGLLFFVLAGLVSNSKSIVFTGLAATGALLAAYFVAWDHWAFWVWIAISTGLPLLAFGCASKFRPATEWP